MGFEVNDTTYGAIAGTVNGKYLVPIDLFEPGGKFFIGDNADGEACIMMSWTPEDGINLLRSFSRSGLKTKRFIQRLKQNHVR